MNQTAEKNEQTKTRLTKSRNGETSNFLIISWSNFSNFLNFYIFLKRNMKLGMGIQPSLATPITLQMSAAPNTLTRFDIH